MHKSYRLVVFDWEGTLSDTQGVWLHVLRLEAEKLHFGAFDEARGRALMASGPLIAIKQLFPQLDTAKQMQLHMALQESMRFAGSVVLLFPGVLALLQRLLAADIQMGIASNKPLPSLMHAITTAALGPFISIVRSASQTALKPEPLMLEEIMAEAGVSPAETLMIGDSVSDIEMAVSIGVDACGFDFYHQEEVALLAAGAIGVFDDYSAVQSILCVGN